MNKLTCDERTCKHNCKCVCKKQSIIVDEDAICCSYQLKNENDSYNEEFALDNYADLETAISCSEESCIFNNESRCKAQEVKIDSDAWCTTYRRR
mgnify:FL=1